MNLLFPPLSGGQLQGLNDAGIETFEGDYAHYVVRECTQNSLDAAAGHEVPVRVEITLHQVPAAQLPFLDGLRAALDSCEQFWGAHPQARDFFRQAAAHARGDSLNLLRISDSQTTGVPGSDDDDTKPWVGLVHSRGLSIKSDEDSGGAFGIGKDAPLAASALRTVLYSTQTLDGKVAFQGISRLATHLAGDERTQGTGFIGGYDVNSKIFTAIRELNDIPEWFRRESPGLDVWVVGVQLELGNWENPFVAAALGNFWPAIQFGRIVLRIGNVEINRTTLPALMSQFRHQDSVKEALPYYEAVTVSGGHLVEEDLPLVGKCRLFVRLGGRDLPRRICLTRKTGMVIRNYPPRKVQVPFAGLFCCDDVCGNKLLKALEPPCHDDWVAKRAKTADQAEALKLIRAWIVTKLKGMIPDLDSESINEDSIADLLPDDLPGPSDSAGDDTDLGGRPKPPDDVATLEPVTPRTRVPGAGSGAGGTGAAGGGKGDTADPGEGDGKGTGGRTGRTGGTDQAGGGAANLRTEINLRSYRTQEDKCTYHLIARADQDHAGSVRIDAVTDEGSAISCPIASACGENGEVFTVADNRISGVTLAAGQPLRLKITLHQPLRVALRASTV
jgi:hypothetical protein